MQKRVQNRMVIWFPYQGQLKLLCLNFTEHFFFFHFSFIIHMCIQGLGHFSPRPPPPPLPPTLPPTISFLFFLFSCFWWYWGLNSWPHACMSCSARHFYVIIFEIGSHTMPLLACTTNLLFVLPHIAGMTDAHRHTQPLVEMGSGIHFAWAGFELWSSQSSLPK
jgi:hypothetical protein